MKSSGPYWPVRVTITTTITKVLCVISKRYKNLLKDYLYPIDVQQGQHEDRIIVVSRLDVVTVKLWSFIGLTLQSTLKTLNINFFYFVKPPWWCNG